MTNASKGGCLPEQTAYWDAALEPAQVAWIAERKRGNMSRVGIQAIERPISLIKAGSRRSRGDLEMLKLE